jgi:hypothetical protein
MEDARSTPLRGQIVTLSQIAADPRAAAGEEFSSTTTRRKFKFIGKALYRWNFSAELWQKATFFISWLIREDWYFVKDGTGEVEA